ncbi:MAG: hypothetical protein ACOC44_15165 [Promethearchaeia archaeon]
MKEIKGIEGDYLQTKENSLFFDIKGLVHPKERKIAFIRFYPDPHGDRVRNGKKYTKIYKLAVRYKFLRENYPQYLFHSEQRDLFLQGVPLKDIKKIYTPRDYFRSLQNKTDLSRMEKCSVQLCRFFIENSNLPEDAIGITGSPMVGLNKHESDIDLVIYGTEISHNFQDSMADILNSGGFCREYNMREYQSHYQWRVGGSNIPIDKFLKSERRKLHQGMFKGFEFFIRYIKSPDDWPSSYYDYEYKDIGRIKLKATITEDEDAIFTPCTYKIDNIDVIEDQGLVNVIDAESIDQVNSYRGRFCEQAKKGELVLIEGKIERVIEKKKDSYYRILLQDQTKDKMLILE